MKTTTPEVARVLGTTAREVRKYLRAHADDWPGVGTGGRYYFTQTDIKRLAKGMGLDMAKKQDDRPGISVKTLIASYSDPGLRQEVLRLRREREARLEAAMREAGVWGVSTAKMGPRPNTGNFV